MVSTTYHKQGVVGHKLTTKLYSPVDAVQTAFSQDLHTFEHVFSARRKALYFMKKRIKSGCIDLELMMTKQPEYEHPINRAIRKMIAMKMSVGKALVRHDGKMVHPVNGYLLTSEQILELDSKNELTSWGIRELAERLDKEGREPILCPVHQIEMQDTTEWDLPEMQFKYCPHPGGCSARYSKETGHITTSDLPSR
jgi:hypothetical protein